MQTCPNCRSPVVAVTQPCHACGMRVVPGTWMSLLTGVAPRAEGWSLSSSLTRSSVFRAVALLVPVWLPVLVALLIGSRSPEAVSLLLALFVFIPGLHVLSNVRGWSGIRRLVACVLYLVVGAVLGYGVLAYVLIRLA
jgi:hypothetical protein